MKNVFKNKKIFITGHNGMVGQSLKNYFINNGAENIITVSRKKLNLLIEKDVIKFIKNKKPDIIVNCAGKVGGILANSTYPIEFLYENILIQLNITKAAFQNNVKHFINLGSSCIYPKKSKQPIKENYLLTSELEKTNEAYALAKIIGLKACEFYNQQYKTSYFTLMPCNLYGPFDNFHLKNSHFVPALIKKFANANKVKAKKVEIWGSGSPKREIMHVDDLASAIFFVLKKKILKDKRLLSYIKNNPVINVGSGQEFSIKKFAKKIAYLSNNSSYLKFNKKYPDGTKRKILDNSLIKKLGWKPKISLDEGLKQAINWFVINK